MKNTISEDPGTEIDSEIDSDSRCQKCIFVFMKGLRQFIAFLFSHIGLTCLVAGYAILGGLLFKAVELPQEKQIRQDVVDTKNAYVNKIVDMFTEDDGQGILDKRSTTDQINAFLKEYQTEVYTYTKERDWDGRFEVDEYQWSFAESLLYSVTVISTIGYGNITPKTSAGRMLTIVYGIFGIPLTMLCLHNIGNLMAGCFRLIYRVACINMTYQYIKLKRRRLKQRFVKRLHGKTRVLQEWARKQQSHVSSLLHHSHVNGYDDNGEGLELVETEVTDNRSRLGNSGHTVATLHSKRKRKSKRRRHSESTVEDMRVKPNHRRFSLSEHKDMPVIHRNIASLHKMAPIPEGKIADVIAIPMNKNADDTIISDDEIIDVTLDDIEQMATTEEGEEDINLASTSSSSLSVTDFDREERILKAKLKETRDLVPISVCLLIMIGYIILGALIFTSWEESWNFLVAFYFCFITLTTIGFGDFVPGMGRLDNDEKRVFGALYLFFGMALLAMSFHLIQEEVKHKFRKLAVRIGLIEQKLTHMLDNYEEKHGLLDIEPVLDESMTLGIEKENVVC